ncbi:Laminin subunit gamma-1 [Intoshia linei]|uniref:Laminin subunit gamma-1 n=1 Tax=Intoshia linei TaxID=1819745 RepID=A0A177B1C2_9BILA|nr:Laminin subunit gamma-1 [Intoshia linei]
MWNAFYTLFLLKIFVNCHEFDKNADYTFISTTHHTLNEEYIKVEKNSSRLNRCYNPETESHVHCYPEFTNAAFGINIIATNTCGEGNTTYFCRQTPYGGSAYGATFCDKCDKSYERKHTVEYINDVTKYDLTWWQSDTLLDADIQYPNSVNITLKLGKSFTITYIDITFQSSRPESFTILKKTHLNSSWIPYQYYSASCEKTYKIPSNDYIKENEKMRALCDDKNSDISPLTNGNVVFAVLDQYHKTTPFEENSDIQEWVTATDILIKLDRMNTFGDEIYTDRNVLKTYFYAISDISIGGRCNCNGHAGDCIISSGENVENRMVCRCQHYTSGIDCEKCLDFYNDRPWAPGTSTDANICYPCNCNNFSDRCYFDQDLYDSTGHGGHCINCRYNTIGINCHLCKPNYYRSNVSDLSSLCVACKCDPMGSIHEQCDDNGKCSCKIGVTGNVCNECLPNFYNINMNGCENCDCNKNGTRNSSRRCRSDSGLCDCKFYVEGRKCNSCMPGYFNLERKNEHGCLACFCYGHSSKCETDTEYFYHSIESHFTKDSHVWIGLDRHNSKINVNHDKKEGFIMIRVGYVQPVYYSLPDSYLGNQLNSYGEYLNFSLYISPTSQPIVVSRDDIIIESKYHNLKVSCELSAQENKPPNLGGHIENYSFQLINNIDSLGGQFKLNWYPNLNSYNFYKLLSNISSIKIRGSYSMSGHSKLYKISLGSGVYMGNIANSTEMKSVTHIQKCICLAGYIGKLCESPAEGYYRANKKLGSFSKSAKCRCNNHSDICNPETGECICNHNTKGFNCEQCSQHYYGDATEGLLNSCLECPCPHNGNCILQNPNDESSELICVNCRIGHVGKRCDQCIDGYYMDSSIGSREYPACKKCICNNNIDLRHIGNCDDKTGECLKCVNHTFGKDCQYCKKGYYGNARKDNFSKDKCKECQCNEYGSLNEICDNVSGQCECKKNITSRKCDICIENNWDLFSGKGCKSCMCHRVGSLNEQCDIKTGECFCLQGVKGVKCDKCIENHFKFSDLGCSECKCDKYGSIDLQCHLKTGKCNCKLNVEGKKCDRCIRNRYSLIEQCQPCPDCYKLVDESFKSIESSLKSFENGLNEISKNTVNKLANITNDDKYNILSNFNIIQLTLKEMNDEIIKRNWTKPINAEKYMTGMDEIKEKLNKMYYNDDLLLDAGYFDKKKALFNEKLKNFDQIDEKLNNFRTSINNLELEVDMIEKEQELNGKNFHNIENIVKNVRKEIEKVQRNYDAVKSRIDSIIRIIKENVDLLKVLSLGPQKYHMTNQNLLLQSYNNNKTLNHMIQLMDNIYREVDNVHTAGLKLSLKIDKIKLSFDEDLLDEKFLQILSKSEKKINQFNNIQNGVQVTLKDNFENQKSVNKTVNEILLVHGNFTSLVSQMDNVLMNYNNQTSKMEDKINETKKIYKSLKDYNKNFTDQQEIAKIEMKKIENIEEMLGMNYIMITNTNHKISEMTNVIDETTNNTNFIDQNAIFISEIMDRNNKKMESLQQNFTLFNKKLDKLMTDSSTTSEKFDRYMNNIKNNSIYLDEMLYKSNQYLWMIENNNIALSNTLLDIEEISKELDTLLNVLQYEQDTIKYQEMFDDILKKYKDNHIDDIYSDLADAKKKQLDSIYLATLSLITYHKSLDKLTKIHDNLPTKCYNNIDPESTN